MKAQCSKISSMGSIAIPMPCRMCLSLCSFMEEWTEERIDNILAGRDPVSVLKAWVAKYNGSPSEVDEVVAKAEEIGEKSHREARFFLYGWAKDYQPRERGVSWSIFFLRSEISKPPKLDSSIVAN